jgi:hypothetical protein
LRPTRLDAINLDRVLWGLEMAHVATGLLTGNGLEKTSRRRRNGKTGFGVQRRENGREKGGFSTRFSVNFRFGIWLLKIMQLLLTKFSHSHSKHDAWWFKGKIKPKANANASSPFDEAPGRYCLSKLLGIDLPIGSSLA